MHQGLVQNPHLCSELQVTLRTKLRGPTTYPGYSLGNFLGYISEKSLSSDKVEGSGLQLPKLRAPGHLEGCFVGRERRQWEKGAFVS